MNALGNDKVADFINENFIATYLKVGTFKIINGNKVGGNVASYFCLYDGGVLHAVPGKTDADTLLNEARWAAETRKSALTRATNLATGKVDMPRYRALIRQAHEERYFAAQQGNVVRSQPAFVIPGITQLVPGKVLPAVLPRHASPQVQAHWLLAANTLGKLEYIYPIVWEKVLNERLSGLPVTKR